MSNEKELMKSSSSDTLGIGLLDALTDFIVDEINVGRNDVRQLVALLERKLQSRYKYSDRKLPTASEQKDTTIFYDTVSTKTFDSALESEIHTDFEDYALLNEVINVCPVKRQNRNKTNLKNSTYGNNVLGEVTINGDNDLLDDENRNIVIDQYKKRQIVSAKHENNDEAERFGSVIRNKVTTNNRNKRRQLGIGVSIRKHSDSSSNNEYKLEEKTTIKSKVSRKLDSEKLFLSDSDEEEEPISEDTVQINEDTIEYDIKANIDKQTKDADCRVKRRRWGSDDRLHDIQSNSVHFLHNINARRSTAPNTRTFKRCPATESPFNSTDSLVLSIFDKVIDLLLESTSRLTRNNLNELKAYLENKITKTELNLFESTTTLTSEMPKWAIKGLLDEYEGRHIEFATILDRLSNFIIQKQGEFLRKDVEQFMRMLTHKMVNPTCRTTSSREETFQCQYSNSFFKKESIFKKSSAYAQKQLSSSHNQRRATLKESNNNECEGRKHNNHHYQRTNNYQRTVSNEHNRMFKAKTLTSSDAHENLNMKRCAMRTSNNLSTDDQLQKTNDQPQITKVGENGSRMRLTRRI